MKDWKIMAPQSEELSSDDDIIEIQPYQMTSRPLTQDANARKADAHLATKNNVNMCETGAITPQKSTDCRALRHVSISGRVLQINVPSLSNADKELYSFLPGHFIVHRVLRQLSDKSYLIERESGETSIVSVKQLQKLRDGPVALRELTMKKTIRRPERLRKRSTSLHRHYIDQPLDLVSSDSSQIRKSTQSSQLYPVSYNMVSVDELAVSSDDLDESTGSPDHRRSARLRHQHVAHNLKQKRCTSKEASDGISSPKGHNRRRARLHHGVSASSSRTELTLPHKRRSERTRERAKHSMRERAEDDFSSQSEVEKKTKIVGTRETFAYISKNDPFREEHQQSCATCLESESRRRGPLVFCQGCTSSYHQDCLGYRRSREHLVTKTNDETFVLQCRRCIGAARTKDQFAPHLGHCAACNTAGPLSEPLSKRLTAQQEHSNREKNGGLDPIVNVDPALINNVKNIMLRCRTCHRAWHARHFPHSDSVKQLEEPLRLPIPFDVNSLQCYTCTAHQEPIHLIVAWRPKTESRASSPTTIVDIAEYNKEYLIKWKDKSYLWCTWLPGTWVWTMLPASSRTAFWKKPQNQLPKMTSTDAIPEDFHRVDIVFDAEFRNGAHASEEARLQQAQDVKIAPVKYRGLSYEDAVWEKPPSPLEAERWMDFKDAYTDFVRRQFLAIPDQIKLKQRLAQVRLADFETTLLKSSQPSNMIGGQMMQYQLEGHNWLYYQWFRQHNAVLADEMGLGKTIQMIAFCATMIQEHGCWPFLIIVPNSTCPNWRREFKKWVPSINAVCYYGSAHARKLTHDYELFSYDGDEAPHRGFMSGNSRRKLKNIRAHVVIASYESIIEETTKRSLLSVPWQGLIVDEGQRLKNDGNLIYETLSQFQFPFRVLMTGTPLQNNARELFNLLQFLNQEEHDAGELEERYAELTKEKVAELHEMLKPYFLRRTKVQVLNFLPPITQIIVPVSMSAVQKRVSKSILARNSHLLRAILSRDQHIPTKERANLNNILMQLRKTLCHPFVYSPELEDRTVGSDTAFKSLVEASSKLQLLSIMLPKLKERGHRVLIFSQFLDNLDIVEDFLHGHALTYQRLDGTINAAMKQKRIDAFNAPSSEYFAFLLSTRAGGVGINLATADTVIILDPDFNPHQDMQALSRAHRIGQEKKVLVFQFLTRSSVEEKIMQAAKKKMALDKVLIEAMDHAEDEDLDVESILKHGAEALFDDSGSATDIAYDDASVNALLDRSIAETSSSADETLAKSQFSFAKIWTNGKGVLENTLDSSKDRSSDPGLWEKILKERERAYAQEMAKRDEQLGRGKRKRGNVDYNRQPPKDSETKEQDDVKTKDDEDREDRDFEIVANETESSSDDGGIDIAAGKSPRRPLKQPKLSTSTESPPQTDGAVDSITSSLLPTQHWSGVQDVPSTQPYEHRHLSAGQHITGQSRNHQQNESHRSLYPNDLPNVPLVEPSHILASQQNNSPSRSFQRGSAHHALFPYGNQRFVPHLMLSTNNVNSEDVVKRAEAYLLNNMALWRGQFSIRGNQTSQDTNLVANMQHNGQSPQ